MTLTARTRRQLTLEHLTRRQVRQIRAALAYPRATDLAEARKRSVLAHRLAEHYGVSYPTIVRAAFQRVFL